MALDSQVPAGAAANRRRWTGIEPAAAGSPQPAALKAVETTRYSYTSETEPRHSVVSTRRYCVSDKTGSSEAGGTRTAHAPRRAASLEPVAP
jgi:hypothetical protein